LRGRGVRDNTIKKYTEFLEELQEFQDDNGLKGSAPDEKDDLIARWITNQFAEGEESFRGSYMIAAVAWKEPRYGKWGSDKLPLARQCLASWKTLSPGLTRLPFASGLVDGLAMQVHLIGGWRMAAEPILQRIFYLRPGEASRLRSRHLIPPGPHGILTSPKWSIILHEAELGIPSKTAEYDESLVLDLARDQWFGSVLRRLKEETHRDDFIFPAKSGVRAEAVKEAGRRLGVDAVPYRFRHSGASIDFSTGARPITGVRHRGRWRSEASVRRYEKGGRITQSWDALSPAVQQYCVASSRILADVLLGRRGPLRLRDT